MQPEVQQSYESTCFKIDWDVKLYIICKVVRKKKSKSMKRDEPQAGCKYFSCP